MSLEEFTPMQVELLEALSDGIPLTRSDFVEELKKPRTTIYDNLEKLENKKLVEKFSKNNGKGRPLTLWHLSRNPLLKLLKRNRKRPDFINNIDKDKKKFEKYKREASIRYTRLMRIQKTIDDETRSQTVISDYFN